MLRKSTTRVDVLVVSGVLEMVAAGNVVTPRIETAIPANARTRWPFVDYQNVE